MKSAKLTIYASLFIILATAMAFGQSRFGLQVNTEFNPNDSAHGTYTLQLKNPDGTIARKNFTVS